MSLSVLSNAGVIFWDFDGVIKESLEIKGEAFAEVFAPFGADTAGRVREHHKANGGVSRYEKIPLYLSWAGVQPVGSLVESYCARFSAVAMERVIRSPWVPGVEAWLKNNPFNQHFFLLSATPHTELLEIVRALDLDSSFLEIHGAPMGKADAIRSIIERYGYRPEECLMIGDSKGDQLAAEKNSITFLLRRHSLNEVAFRSYEGCSVADFSEG